MIKTNYLDLQAPAKINLALDVLARREDGYHNVRMVMQMLHLADSVHVERRSGKTTTLSCSEASLPTDERNLAMRAWQILADNYALTEAVHIHIEKKIPLAAGLAGGSADAAAVLLAVNALFDLQLPMQRLGLLGSRLGADVPFGLLQGTALAQGIGDRLTPLGPAPKFYVLLVNAGFDVPTPQVYQHLQLTEQIVHPDVDGMKEAIARGDGKQVLALCGNVLETSAFGLYPQLAAMKAEVAACGLTALMSGSGGTILGLSEDLGKVQAAANIFQAKYPYVEISETP